MVRGKEAKVASLVLTVIVLSLQCLNTDIGLFPGCTAWDRALYPLVHANIFHALLNCWCLLSVVFLFEIGFGTLILGYVASVVYPVDLLPYTAPTVGLSAICYYLLGVIALRVRDKWKFQAFISLYIILGFIIPSFNGLIHLYGYVVGLLVGFLNTPITWKR